MAVSRHPGRGDGWWCLAQLLRHALEDAIKSLGGVQADPALDRMRPFPPTSKALASPVILTGITEV
jgi:hypothetical protein